MNERINILTIINNISRKNIIPGVAILNGIFMQKQLLLFQLKINYIK